MQSATSGDGKRPASRRKMAEGGCAQALRARMRLFAPLTAARPLCASPPAATSTPAWPFAFVPQYNVQGGKTLRFETGVVTARNPEAAQPNGQLGGMPALARLLMAQLPMSRLQPAWCFSSLQNAHFIVTAAVHDGEEGSGPVADAALQCLEAGCWPASRQEALPGYADAMGRLPLAEPLWRSSNTSGTYGSLYRRCFDELHAAQTAAAAVEHAVLATQEAPPAAIPTRLAGYATVQIEEPMPGAKFHYMTPSEARQMMMWTCNAWAAEIGEYRGKAPHSVPAPQRELYKTLLAARAADETVKLAERKQGALANLETLFSLPTPNNRAAPAGEPFAAPARFLHLTVVVGHPGAPGAGAAAMRRACELADSLGMPMMLEALPNTALPVYYARYGFRPVVYVGAGANRVPFTEAVLTNQTWVYMWREPSSSSGGEAEGQTATEEGEEVEAPSPAPLSAALAAAVFADDGVDDVAQCMRRPRFRYMRKATRPEWLHLSVAAEALTNDLFVWTKSKGENSVVITHSWAREYTRQVRAGEYTANRIPVPATDPEPPAPSLTPSPTEGTSSSSSSGRRVRTATEALLLQEGCEVKRPSRADTPGPYALPSPVHMTGEPVTAAAASATTAGPRPVKAFALGPAVRAPTADAAVQTTGSYHPAPMVINVYGGTVVFNSGGWAPQ